MSWPWGWDGPVAVFGYGVAVGAAGLWLWVEHRLGGALGRIERQIADLCARNEPSCAARDGGRVVVHVDPGELARVSSGLVPGLSIRGQQTTTLSLSAQQLADQAEAALDLEAMRKSEKR